MIHVGDIEMNKENLLYNITLFGWLTGNKRKNSDRKEKVADVGFFLTFFCCSANMLTLSFHIW